MFRRPIHNHEIHGDYFQFTMLPPSVGDNVTERIEKRPFFKTIYGYIAAKIEEIRHQHLVCPPLKINLPTRESP